jgi:hypothetical protein
MKEKYSEHLQKLKYASLQDMVTSTSSVGPNENKVTSRTQNRLYSIDKEISRDGA